MCTLSYFLKPSGDLILTSNRDESLLRETATFPQKIIRRNTNILAPIDPLGGGSWFAVNNKAKAGCLLNGAFGRHIPDPPYKKSRGIVLLDALTFDNAAQFAELYDLNNIEPFTLVLINYIPELSIEEIKWDGKEILVNNIEKGQPQVWSSPMMYPHEVHHKTIENFQSFLNKNPDPDIDNLYKFNFSESYKKKLSIHNIEKIPILGTISISTIFISKKVIRYIYRDIKSKAKFDTTLVRSGDQYIDMA